MTALTQDELREAYRERMDAYGDALTNHDASARELLAEAAMLWDRLREFEGLDQEVDADAHLVLAMSHAVAAGAKEEAKRIYESMSDEYRAMADEAESRKLISLKIWLR